jgi:hypothetical protein
MGVAHFVLKGTQSKRPVTRVRNKRLGVKKHAPGFERCDFSLASKWVERGQLGTFQHNLGSFLLFSPDFFFLASASQRKWQCSCPFFWGGVYDLFFPQPFFDLRRISVGVFSELKIPKSEDHLLKPGKLGPF